MENERHTITVTVSGAAGTGKSTIMTVIHRALWKAGIDHTQQYPLGGDSQVAPYKLDDCLVTVKDTVQVEIYEKRTRGQTSMSDIAERIAKLDALESAGVDTWAGYPDAMMLMDMRLMQEIDEAQEVTA